MNCEGKQQQWPIKYFINGSRLFSTRPRLPAIRVSFAANPGFFGVLPTSELLCCVAK
jgi:hypothetical protein